MWIIPIVLMVLLGLAASYPRLRRKAILKKWYKTYALSQHQAAFHEIFSDVNGFVLSQQSRALYNVIDYTYGEIEYIPFVALLCMTKPHNNTVFYDLGSGTGKAVLACAMTFKIRKSCGIELLLPLHSGALNQQHRLQQQPLYSDKARSVHFIHGNFLENDFSDATLIFINATAFFGETWDAINQHLLHTKIGTTIITTSKKLSSDAFTVINTTMVNMSWGLVKAYIQQRASSLHTVV